MRKIIVVNNIKDWDFKIDEVDVISAKAYLTEPKYFDLKNVRIFNLCRSYKYQSTGYYVSLLAEARGQKVIPEITTVQDLRYSTIIKLISDDIDELIQKKLARIKSQEFTLSIYLGENVAKQYDELCRKIYALFQVPFLRAHFVFNKKWVLKTLSAIPVKDIPEHHKVYLEEIAKNYFSKTRYDKSKPTRSIYDLAILVNPKEKNSPSDQKALQKFIQAGETLGFYVELITKEDYGRLAEFDGLFIRETTSVNHHTYRFARRAFREGLAVIDDPQSILKCTNKVYLAELLQKAKIPIPKTTILYREADIFSMEHQLTFPTVIKKPDSSFSQGVIKIKTAEELKESLKTLFKDSDLIIAQEFLPTDFDWRIGVLDQKPLYACKYYMAKGHWQIYNWEGKEIDSQTGGYQTIPINEVPKNVIQTAVKGAALIGDGLYGVDLKEIDGQVYIIEINDNPNLDEGVEDAFLKDELYLEIMRSFKRRIEINKGINEGQSVAHQAI